MYTIRTVAAKLQLSPKRVYALLHQGLEHYRIGGSIRIDEAQLQRFLESRKRKEGGDIVSPPRAMPRAQLKHIQLDY